MARQVTLQEITTHYQKAFKENKDIVRSALGMRKVKSEPVVPTLRPPKSPFPERS